MSITLSLAPHVGAYVAATDGEHGALLAIALAAGVRGEHRVSVLETQGWTRVATFPIPSRAKSGVTPIDAEGELLFANDDHTIAAFVARTGVRRWERSFPAPATVRMHDVVGGRILVSIVTPDYRTETRLLRAADGTDEATLPVAIVPSLVASALGRDGSVVLVAMRVVDVARPGAELRRWPLELKRYGMTDVAALDEAAERVVIGTRSGDVVVMDLRTGAATTVLQVDDCIRSVGFHGDAPWALDASGRLRFLGEGGSRGGVDLGVSTYGGLLGADGTWFALGDVDTRTFRVRTLPTNEEVFATTPGFAAEAVGIDAAGTLYLGSGEKLLGIEHAGGKIKKAGSGATEIARLGDGTMLYVGATVRALRPGTEKPVVLSKSAEEVAAAAGCLFAMSGQTAEIWDIASARRTFRLDLETTWLGETNEALRLLHLGSDGRPWIHMSDGNVYRGDALDDETCHVGRLDPEGVLWLHPDGASLYWARGRTITRLAIDGFTEGPPLPLAIEADVGKLVFSPSGRRLAAFHRNGRLSSVDLVNRRAVAIASAETSAAERAPNEIFVTDLMTPHGCGFGASEQTIAWTHAGGIIFADAETGAIRGQLMVATAGTDFAVTDGVALDWPKAGTKKLISSEITASEGGTVLDAATYAARRSAGVLAMLTR